MSTLYSDAHPRDELDANSIEYNLREDIGCLKEDIQELVDALRPFANRNIRSGEILFTDIETAIGMVKKYEVK